MTYYQKQIEMILTSPDTNRLLRTASESAPPGTMLVSYIKLDTSDHRNNVFSCQVIDRTDDEIRLFVQSTLSLTHDIIERMIDNIKLHKLIDASADKQLLVFFSYDSKFYIDRIMDVTVLF